MLVLAEVATAASTFVTLPVSSALMPNCPMMLLAMSAALAKSKLPACAKVSTCGRADMICPVLNPAMPRNSIAPAASDAEKTVVAPNFRACSSSLAMSPEVAPVMAETLFIAASKSPAVLSASAPNATTGAVMPMESWEPMLVILLPTDSNFFPKASNLLAALVRLFCTPSEKRLTAASIFPIASSALPIAAENGLTFAATSTNIRSTAMLSLYFQVLLPFLQPSALSVLLGRPSGV